MDRPKSTTSTWFFVTAIAVISILVIAAVVLKPAIPDKVDLSSKYYSYGYQNAVDSKSITPTPTPSPTPIIAPQQQMSYADWQKQEAARVEAEQDRKAFEESNESRCKTIAVTTNEDEFSIDSNSIIISHGTLAASGCWSWALQHSMWACGGSKISLNSAETVCTGKRNGEPFTEVQSVVRWDSAGNEIENVTFTRG